MSELQDATNHLQIYSVRSISLVNEHLFHPVQVAAWRALGKETSAQQLVDMALITVVGQSIKKSCLKTVGTVLISLQSNFSHTLKMLRGTISLIALNDIAE